MIACSIGFACGFLCFIETANAKCNDFRTHRNYFLLNARPVCGTKNDGLVVGARILNGSLVNLGEFPWLVNVQVERKDIYESDWDDKWTCGGVLINKRHVLTSAQCVEDKPDHQIRAKVRVGEWWLANDGDDCQGDRCAPRAMEFKVKLIIAHSGYDKKGHNDIALLRVWIVITFTDFVRPICLPLPCGWQERELESTDLVLAGWGDIQVKPWVVAANLPQKMKVEIISNTDCENVYNNWKSIQPSQMCGARVPGVAPCEGDRGGPVQLEQWIDGKPYYFLMGIVSDVFPCSYKGVHYLPPHVFTRVSHYLKWILDNIQSK